MTEELPDWERFLAGDQIPVDLRGRFDEVLAQLEAAAGWQTERFQRPVLILGRLDGIQSGIRQLRRKRPLDYEVVGGLRVPTLPEMARIKAWLLATRNTVRDYLDCVVLLDRLGDEGAKSALSELDSLYEQENGASVLVEVVDRLAFAEPTDQSRIDLSTYRGLKAPWNDWDHLKARGRHLGQLLAPLSLKDGRR